MWTILAAVHFILFLIAAFEIITGSKTLGKKVLWLLIILIFPLVGVIAYYLVGRG